MPVFLKGFIIGISIAAPVGPIGVLCIQRTLSNGNINGFITGLGAASADAIYGFVAAFGLTFISNFLVEQQLWFRIIGGLFLIYLGVKAFLSTPASTAFSDNKPNHFSAYGTTFLLTLSNPMTILSFAAIFAGLGLVDQSIKYGTASLMVTGVFIGSGTWWIFLSSSTYLFRNKLSKRLVWVNRISGIIITTFGAAALCGIFFT